MKLRIVKKYGIEKKPFYEVQEKRLFGWRRIYVSRRWAMEPVFSGVANTEEDAISMLKAYYQYKKTRKADTVIYETEF